MRFDTAFDEAKTKCAQEAAVRLNHIMRNASLEMRDKVEQVEGQTSVAVRRAVDEAMRLAEARAERDKREIQREVELAASKQVAQINSMASMSARRKVAEMQETVNTHVADAVREAVAQERETAAQHEAVAVRQAVTAAVSRTEAKLSAQNATLERQLVAVTKDMEYKLANFHSEEQARVLIAQAREEALREKSAAVRQAVDLVQRKAMLQMQKMAEGLSEKMAEAVRLREKQLLADNSKGLKALADADLKEQTEFIRHAAMAAAEQWGRGNDAFEEEALASTWPSSLLGSDKSPSRRSAGFHSQPRDTSGIVSADGKWADLVEHKAHAQVDTNVSLHHHQPEKPTARDDELRAPSAEAIQMRARHTAELHALALRQETDQRMSPKVEKEGLHKQHMAEAMAAGLALVQEERAKLTMDE